MCNDRESRGRGVGVEGRGWRGGGSGERARISKVVVVGRVRTRE